MNAGKDAYTLMQEIKLPASLAVEELYGNITWTVRGIFEGYVGWFDANISNMYPTAPSSVYGEVVTMAGGANAVAARASQMVDEGKLQEALHMTDMALAAEPDNSAAIEVRLKALRALRDKSLNSNEIGWLDSTIKKLEDRLSRP